MGGEGLRPRRDVDENEPEVLLRRRHHADEHMGVEMTLRILHWLADGLRQRQPGSRDIVDSREIWIVFSVNPDGAAYDITTASSTTGARTASRHPGPRYIGTDLNRNYGYRWGGWRADEHEPARPSRTADRTRSRRPRPRRSRDFLKPGRRRPAADPDRHHVPRDRTPGDVAVRLHVRERAVRHDERTTTPRSSRIGRRWRRPTATSPSRRATCTSRRARPATTLYGIVPDLLVHVRDVVTRLPGRLADRVRDRPEQGRRPVPRRTGLVPAGGPGQPTRRALRRVRRRLRGRTRLGDGPGRHRHGATSRRVEPGDPAGTSRQAGRSSLAPSHPGRATSSTGPGGRVVRQRQRPRRRSTIRSTPITLPSSAGQQLFFRWSFAHDGHATAADSLKAIVETAGGAKTAVFTRSGSGVVAKGGWRSASIPLDAWHGQTIRIVFVASDLGADNLVEASLDDIRVTLPTS